MTTLKPFVINSNILSLGPPCDYPELVRTGELGLDNNTGNGYIYYAMSRIIYGKFVRLPDIKNMWEEDLDTFDVDAINNGGYTHVFFMFQSHIGEHAFHFPWGRLGRFVERLKLPLVVFSLGAISPNHKEDYDLHQKLPADMMRCFHSIAERSVSLSVRGAYSAAVLERMGIDNFKIVGCPTYFENGPDRVVDRKKWDESLGVLATGWFSNAALSKKLHFVFQDAYQDAPFFKGMIKGGTLDERDLASLGVPVYDDYIADACNAFLEGRTSVFSDMDKWKKLIVGNFNLAIGTRVHGGIIALNSGVPAVVTNGDPRAREMCQLFAIPYMPELWGHSTNIDLRRLHQEIDLYSLNQRYAQLYAGYVDWLKENGVELQIGAVNEEFASGKIALTSRAERTKIAADCMRHIIKVRDARIDELEEYGGNLNRGLTDTTAQVAALTAQNAEMSSQIADLSAQQARITSQSAELSSQLADMTSQKAELSADLASQKAEMTLQLDDMTSEKAAMFSQLAELTSQKAAMTLQLADLAAQKAQMTGRQAELMTQISGLMAQNAEVGERNVEMRTRLVACEARIDLMEQAVARVHDENASMVNELAAAREHTTGLQRGIAVRDNEVAALKSKYLAKPAADAREATPGVTVIVTCYSNSSYFISALDSVLQQTANNVHVIIQNNGCNPDYSSMIMNAARERNVEVIANHPNTYGLALRELALPKVTTKYVAVLHDDDVYMPDKISKSLAALERSGADYVVTNRLYIDGDGNEITPDNDAINPRPFTGDETAGQLIVDMLRPPGCRLHFSTLVLRTSVARESMLGDPFWPRIADAYFWVDLLTDDRYSGVVLRENLSKIRIHGQNDLLYEKFDPRARTRLHILLGMSEINLFKRILRRASDAVLIQFLEEFADISRGCTDRVRALIEAAVNMDRRTDLWLSKSAMVSQMIHAAFASDGVGALTLLQEMANEDAAMFMARGLARTENFLQNMVEGAR